MFNRLFEELSRFCLRELVSLNYTMNENPLTSFICITPFLAD
ncbi:hypothetical protein [Anaerocolumna jejuensis]